MSALREELKRSVSCFHELEVRPSDTIPSTDDSDITSLPSFSETCRQRNITCFNTVTEVEALIQVLQQEPELQFINYGEVTLLTIIEHFSNLIPEYRGAVAGAIDSGEETPHHQESNLMLGSIVSINRIWNLCSGHECAEIMNFKAELRNILKVMYELLYTYHINDRCLQCGEDEIQSRADKAATTMIGNTDRRECHMFVLNDLMSFYV